jgi:hypothetical protein
LFPAGPILSEERQIGRGPQIEALANRLRVGDVVRIFDRRRWGKSSAARAAIERLRDQGLIAERVPLDEYPTSAAAAAYVAHVFSGRARRAADAGRGAAGRRGQMLGRAGEATQSAEIGALGELLAQVSPERLTLAEVLHAVPAELARTDKRAALAIDEAHLIAEWAPEERAAVRGFLAHGDRRVGVLLGSSDQRASDTLRRSDVLGYLGEEFPLPPIARADWEVGLRRRFKQAELPIEQPALELLLEESRCHPYCTMLLAKHCAELAQPFGSVTASVVRLALPTVRRHEAWNLR